MDMHLDMGYGARGTRSTGNAVNMLPVALYLLLAVASLLQHLTFVWPNPTHTCCMPRPVPPTPSVFSLQFNYFWVTQQGTKFGSSSGRTLNRTTAHTTLYYTQSCFKRCELHKFIIHKLNFISKLADRYNFVSVSAWGVCVPAALWSFPTSICIIDWCQLNFWFWWHNTNTTTKFA